MYINKLKFKTFQSLKMITSWIFHVKTMILTRKVALKKKMYLCSITILQ